MLDFLGIGAQKAGTTWMFEWLRKHPEVHFPHIKEISFWNSHYPRSLADPDYKKNIHWYRSLFNHWEESGDKHAEARKQAESLPPYQPGWFDRIMRLLDPPKPAQAQAKKLSIKPEESHLKLGEISPTYCYFEDNRTIESIREFAPNVRLLLTTRHPIDRAWSSAQMAIKRAEMKPEEASDQWYLDHFHSELSLKYGDYEKALDAWLAVFPREQLLLQQFEDMRRQPHAFLRRCLEHIGVKEIGFFDSIPEEALGRKVFEGTGKEIRPSLLPALEALYNPKIERLKSRYGIDYTHLPSHLKPEVV